MTTRDDLVSRLRYAHANSQQRILGSNIFEEAASALETKDAEIARWKEVARTEAEGRQRMDALAFERFTRISDLERQLAEETERCALLEKLHAFVVEHYANQDMNHMDFRVDAYVIAAALEQSKEK